MDKFNLPGSDPYISLEYNHFEIDYDLEAGPKDTGGK
jgi:hypothetical protein